MNLHEARGLVNDAPGHRVRIVGFRRAVPPFSGVFVEQYESSELQSLQVVRVALRRFPRNGKERRSAARYAKRLVIGRLEL